MIFVEGFRLLFVLAGSVAGFEIGRHVDGNPHSPVIGLLLGAAVSYVARRCGRAADRQGAAAGGLPLPQHSPRGDLRRFHHLDHRDAPRPGDRPAPAWSYFRSGFAVLTTAVTSPGCWPPSGGVSAQVKGRQIVAAAGLSRILAPHVQPHPGHALLVDASAIMDRFLLVLGRGGLLSGGLVIPQFVVDHVRAVAEVPDPVSSRRAWRGLESVEALREMGVPVHIARDEVPEVDDPTIKLLTVARRVGLRIGTCSSNIVDEAARWELAVVDLRGIANALDPRPPAR